ILKSQNGENQIEQKLNRISGLKSARQVSYDKLVRATFDADTTSDFSNTYDMILGFMETQTDLHAKEKLTDLYIHKGLFDNALSVLCDIENIAENTDDESLLNSVKVKEIKIDLLRTHSIEEAQNVIQNNAEYLKELASDYNTKEGGVARAILESAGLWDNFPIVFLPNPEGEISTKSTFIEPQEEEKPIVNYELESLFKLYPNPANDYLSVEFINPNGNCTFSIYSIKGELLKTITSNQQIGFISIDISNLSLGNYIINCPELQSKINFVVAR
ncbi:MAG: T9SS type A sorting domain-containing protein, partial [Bacteroidales bacterium]|nr:T9SS type A sorting domain-containing protein [Bacteroidales bacterium]